MSGDNWFIGISYVGGREYLDRALASLGKFRAHVFIVNSSDAEPLGILGEITPEVPMTHTQTHVWFQRAAIRHDCDFFLVMHADAEASEDTVEKLVGCARAMIAEGRRWAVAFTNYDALAAYSVAAAREVGEWDWRLFPSYYSDNDFHRRCRLAGYELVETGLPVKHIGSHVINKVDKWARLRTRVQMDHWAAVYVEKWGDHPGQETLRTPFGIPAGGEPYPDGD